MIEILNGLHETINYGDSLGLKLYHNVEYEDYPEHWHTGIEIIMPVSTEYTVLVGGERFHLNTGDIIIVNSGVLHGLEAPPAGERIILQFDAALLYTLKEMETLVSLLPPVLLLVPGDDDGVYRFAKERMDRIVEEYDEGRTFREAVIYATLIEIYVMLGRTETTREIERQEGAGKIPAMKQKEYLEVIMAACNYINQHYQENLSLEETAGISGFSKFHLPGSSSNI